jgi:hypothetical protein
MHAMPGIALGDVMAMDWIELVQWWGEARQLLEGPEDRTR